MATPTLAGATGATRACCADRTTVAASARTVARTMGLIASIGSLLEDGRIIIASDMPSPAPVDSLLHAIGHTPLMRLHRVVAPNSADVVVKLEYFNPTGSYKDRM